MNRLGENAIAMEIKKAIFASYSTNQNEKEKKEKELLISSNNYIGQGTLLKE